MREEEGMFGRIEDEIGLGRQLVRGQRGRVVGVTGVVGGGSFSEEVTWRAQIE